MAIKNGIVRDKYKPEMTNDILKVLDIARSSKNSIQTSNCMRMIEQMQLRYPTLPESIIEFMIEVVCSIEVEVVIENGINV